MQSAAYTFFPPIEATDTTVGRSEEVFIGIYSVEGNDQDDIIVWGDGLDYGDASLAGTEYNIKLFTHQGCDDETTICTGWMWFEPYLYL